MTRLFLILILLVGCSHEDKRPEEVAASQTQVISTNIAPDAGSSMEIKQVAAETYSPFSTEIRFARKSASLTKESKLRLARLAKQALKKGAISEIDAYVWGDQDSPGGLVKKLPPKEKNLASARGEKIKDYFAHLDPSYLSKVKVITMTEQPSGLAAALPKASRAAVSIQLVAK